MHVQSKASSGARRDQRRRDASGLGGWTSGGEGSCSVASTGFSACLVGGLGWVRVEDGCKSTVRRTVCRGREIERGSDRNASLYALEQLCVTAVFSACRGSTNGAGSVFERRRRLSFTEERDGKGRESALRHVAQVKQSKYHGILGPRLATNSALVHLYLVSQANKT